MSFSSDFTISRYSFDATVLSELSSNRYAKDSWPVVYILSDGTIKEAYVGETTDAVTRMSNHLRNSGKNKLSAAYIISSGKFNKSATLDLESSLIKYIAGDGQYRLLNANLGLANHHYYQKTDVYRPLFHSIWDKMRKIGLAKHSLSHIDNSDLFKYSPYKTLSKEQRAGLIQIIDCLLDEGYKNILIHGGAGTGKTILAIFLFKLLNTDLNAYNFRDFGEDDLVFATKVKALQEKYPNPKMALVIPMSSFRNTIKRVFKNVKGLNSNMVVGPSDVVRNNYDIVLVDEAHRLRRRVNLGTYFGVFDKTCALLGLDRNSCSELDWVLQKSRKAIFFYDEDQSIKPSDARREDFQILKASGTTKVERLVSQFRVKGGNGYVSYVNDLLAVKSTLSSKNLSFPNYELLLFDNITDFRNEIKKRDSEYGLSRIVAGYSWPWISKNDPSVADITIDGVGLRWNSVSDDWVNSPSAIDEVGCIHTTQGYDLNYGGIIFGKEISYDKTSNEIVILEKNYHDRNGKQTIKDPAELKTFILNIYKTIMLRGIRGTYVYVCDPALREYFSKHIPTFRTSDVALNLEGTAKKEMIPYLNAVPLYDLAVAAGNFSPPQTVEDYEWVSPPAHIKVSKDLFACRIVGESMNKIIANGSVCLFRKYSGGSRNGKIVLVELSHLQDPDYGSNYTVKEYESTKTYTEMGEWAHELIRLNPLSFDSGYRAIELREDELTHIRVIGEFVEVID